MSLSRFACVLEILDNCCYICTYVHTYIYVCLISMFAGRLEFLSGFCLPAYLFVLIFFCILKEFMFFQAHRCSLEMQNCVSS